MQHPTTEEIDRGVDHVRSSPPDRGSLDLIVRRPDVDQREVLERGSLALAEGLVGDSWQRRGSSRTADGGPHPDMQLNVMNVRVARLLAGDESRIPLAGDQLYVDLDLSSANLPAGTRLRIGEAEIEVTDQPHTGCAKFADRFGMDAARFVNSAVGRELNMRGINARVVEAGTIRVGDRVEKVF